MGKTIISTAEAAKMLEVSERTIARAVHKGEIRAAFGGIHKNRIRGVYLESVEKLKAGWINA